MIPRYRVAALGFSLLLALVGSPAAFADSIYDVTIGTSSLAGSGATLAFDLTSGGSLANTASISSFSSDALLGSNGPNSGSATGALPGVVSLDTKTYFFNEYLQGLTLGNSMSFQLDVTTNAPTGGALPDTLAFFILDPTASYSLPTTSDPTGANSLFTLQIDGSPSGVVGNYGGTPSGVDVTLTSVSVPEPGTLGLMAIGLLGAIGIALRRNRGSSTLDRGV